MDASNVLKYKLIDEREKSASEWIAEQILKKKLNRQGKVAKAIPRDAISVIAG